MGPPLLLPLLLPLLPAASLQAGGSAECKLNPNFGVYQPEHLSAPEGGSIDIPFSFCYSWQLASDPKMSISWRWKDFHGKFIYNTTLPFTRENFKNRLFLNWTKGQTSGSLRISNLRREDETKYFFRVRLTTRDHGEQVWQSIEGTNLTITRGDPSLTLRRRTRTLGMKADGILYASLTLSSLASPSPPAPPGPLLPGSPQEETLYSTLKT
uniref:Immunoglobulin domain-containing protein n=1 Tax=Pipistrellus kuhlii TaxID=59472 RepID=A0A7J7YYD3_PIPKU|nr:hypothetical protein mPipKuh1_013548 [Pipistrellus kuhlii]